MFADRHVSNDEISFSKPAVYQIKVAGEISQDLSELLMGMEIVREGGEGKKMISLIIGEIRDQAALAGLLNMLYEMHYVILSLEMIKNEKK